ncbi:MAG: hypothetical protein IT221_12090 [Fluviicola sp.]|nr:hypothetical protein [Fluviicola sp.]
MKLLYTLLFLIFSGLTASAQEMVDVFVITKDFKTDKKEGGVTVRILDGSTVVQSAVSPANGKVSMQAPAGKVYKLEISKAGKVTRYATLNLKGVSSESVQGAGNVRTQDIPIGLFEELPNVDYSYVKSNPFTEFYFESGNPVLKYDDIVADRMAKKIEKIIAESDAQKGQNDAKFNEAIKNADALYTQKKYEEALKAYQAALALKPEDKHANERFIEIEGILKAQKNANAANAQVEEDYKNLITAANTLRDQKKYDEAIAKYQEALTKKQEQYPKDEIVKCQTAAANAKKDAENQAKYDDAMKAAAGFVTQKSWMAAKDKYKEALKAKPNDPTALAKIAEIDGKLNEQKSEQDKKKKFDETVTAADALFGQEKWAEAKAKYAEAMALNSSAAYPVEKSKECDAKLAEIEAAKAKEAQITKLLAEGNTAFDAKQWPASKAKYQEVIKLDATNATATARLTEIESKIAEEKANAEKIAQAKKLVTEGDALAKATKNEDAKAKYVQAQALYEDPAVKAKIDAIDALLASAAQKAELKAKFDKAIQEGDAALAANDLAGAKAKYTEAGTLDAASPLPKQKIAEVDKRIAANQAAADKEKKYSEAYLKGVEALNAKDYPTAKTKLLEAVAADNTKQEAKDKLAEVDKIIADNAAQAANQAKYEAAIKAGNELQTAGKLAEAKVKFQDAQKLDPAQTLPATKIKEIDDALANADKAKQVNQLITDGTTALTKKDATTAKAKFEQALALDPSNTQASAKLQEVAKLEADLANEAANKAKFDGLKKEGMDLFAAGNYEGAKQKLNEAKAIKADAEIDKKLTEIDKKIAETAAQAETKAKYDKAIADASSLLTGGKLAEAKAKYQEASKIDPSQTLPLDKIKEIDSQIAATQKQQQITTLLAEGNTALDAKQYPAAKTKFQQVLALDATNAEAKSKLDAAIKAENDLASEADKQAKLTKLKADGTALMGQAKYQDAKNKFVEANTIEIDPAITAKIAECDAKIAEAAKGAETEQKYATAIAEGKALEAAKNYDGAIAKFNEALNFKDAQEPKDRIAAINKIKENLLNQAQLDAQAAEKEQRYNNFMNEAKTLEAAKNYDGAIAKYNEALGVKVAQEPKDRIAAINKIKEDQAKQAILDAQAVQGAEKELKYTTALTEGKALEAAKNYDGAIAKYNEALTYKSAQEPQDRIAAINKLKSESNQKEQQFLDLVKKGDTEVSNKDFLNAIKSFDQALAIKNDPAIVAKRSAAEAASKTESESAEQQQYQKILDVGQKAIDEKNYVKAKEMYNRALSLRPTDPLPKQKIAEIDGLIKAEKEAQDKLVAYSKKVTEAEAAAKAGKIENAISLFEQAKTIKPDEIVPDNRIAELKALLSNVVDPQVEINKRYQAAMDAGNAAATSKNFNGALTKYQEALSIKANDKAAQDKIAEMQQLLDDIAKNNKNKAEIDALIAKADALFNDSKWSEAKTAYEVVLSKDGSNVYSTNQIALCDLNMKDDRNKEIEKEYRKIIAKADENFNTADYKKAVDYYQRALKNRPTDPYPKKKLAEIEQLLKPKTPKTVTPPVVTPPVVATLDSLPKIQGTQTDNSLVEGAGRLEAASAQRKGRIGSRFKKRVDKINDQSGVLSDKQKAKTLENDGTLATIQQQNSKTADSSDVNRQENVSIIDVKEGIIDGEALVSNTIEEADAQDQKSQLNVATKSAEEQNSILDGSAVENHDVLDKKTKELETNTGVTISDDHKQNINNDVQFMDIKINNSNKTIDDFNEHKEVESYVLEVDQKVAENNTVNDDKEASSIEAMETKLVVISDVVAAKDMEDVKQSPVNKEELNKVQQVYNDQSTADAEEHSENSLKFKESINTKEQVVIDFEATTGESRKENAEYLEKGTIAKEELDRADFNETYEKSLNNKSVIINEVIELEKYADLPSVVSEANTVSYQEINKGEQAKGIEVAQEQQLKHEANQQVLNNSKTEVEQKTIDEAGQSNNNAEVLKSTQNGLGDADVALSKEQTDKSQSAKQLLAAIEKKEIKFDEKTANDIGKLFPEGVSQEQYDQNGSDGLVSAIVTRRIVVKNGHGDVYLRIQTVEGITFSKNGQPCTEITWQRETQDSMLKRNY